MDRYERPQYQDDFGQAPSRRNRNRSTSRGRESPKRRPRSKSAGGGRPNNNTSLSPTRSSSKKRSSSSRGRSNSNGRGESPPRSRGGQGRGRSRSLVSSRTNASVGRSRSYSEDASRAGTLTTARSSGRLQVRSLSRGANEPRGRGGGTSTSISKRPLSKGNNNKKNQGRSSSSQRQRGRSSSQGRDRSRSRSNRNMPIEAVSESRSDDDLDDEESTLVGRESPSRNNIRASGLGNYRKPYRFDEGGNGNSRGRSRSIGGTSRRSLSRNNRNSSSRGLKMQDDYDEEANINMGGEDDYRDHQNQAFDANTHAGETKFTNVTIESFLPNHLNNAASSVSGVKTGQCLFTEFRNIHTWSVEVILHQLLSGLTVMCAQFPECLSYAYIAGIDPFHALQATWIANILTPIIGGRPGLMCGSSGLGAVAIRYVVMMWGQEYVYYAVILSGFCQVLFGALRIGKYLRLLPPGVTIGMVNALCAMLVLLQLRYFKELPNVNGDEESAVISSMELESIEHVSSTIDEPMRYLEEISTSKSEEYFNQPWAYFYGYDLPWTDSLSQVLVVSLQAALAMAICFVLPRFMTIVPSGLVAIVVVSLINAGMKGWTDLATPTIDDYCTSELPSFRFWQGIFHSSYNLPSLAEWSTLTAVVPAGLSLLCIHLLETMVAINVVDKYTVVDSEQDRVFYGQGVANLAGGLMGGMGSTGLPHASLHSLRMGGKTSAGVFCAGIYLLMVMTFAYPAVASISLGSTMGVTLYLIGNMVQWRPIVSLLLKLVPNCIARKMPPVMGKFRLATPDLFATFVTSATVLCGSTYALAGYLTGVLCYACDPIGHAIILNDDGDGYNFAALEFDKPSSLATKGHTVRKRRTWRKGRGASTATRTEQEETRMSEPMFEGDEQSAVDQICEAICGD